MALSNDSSAIYTLPLPDTFGFDVSTETGEIRDQIETPFERQRRNHLRRAVAQEIMVAYRPVKQLLSCGASLGKVQVWKAIESTTAHLVGAQTCGHVWLCGVCSPKISVKRGHKLARALVASASLAVGVALVTLTLRHHAEETFADVLDRLSHLFSKLTDGRFASKFREQFRIVGTVRVIEVTHGLNGWHPHVHQLLFFQGLQDLEAMRETVFRKWCASSKKLWGDELGSAAVDIRDGRDAALYVSKMGLEAELVGAPWKSGCSSSSVTHFQLLDSPDSDARSLFRQFGESISRSGGKRSRTLRQVVWSRGLAKSLGLDEELSDEEIAAQHEEPARMLGQLTADQWRVLTESGRDSIPNVLRLAATSGWSAVELFISLLSGSQTSPRGVDEPSPNAAQRNSYV
jgi:Replication protein